MHRRGFTLIEIIIVLVMIGIIAGFGIPRVGRGLVRQNVRSARDAVIAMHAKARAVAIQRGRSATLRISGNSLLILSNRPVTGAVDTVGPVQNLGSRYGVTVTATQTDIVFDSRGIGTGGSDTRITVSRSTYQDSVVVNAFGRIVR